MGYIYFMGVDSLGDDPTPAKKALVATVDATPKRASIWTWLLAISGLAGLAVLVGVMLCALGKAFGGSW